MKYKKFKKLKAYNILCFGPEGIEIDFESMGNIVRIRGRNLDAEDSSNTFADNGSGKSSIMDVISYIIYGKTIKKPKKLGHAEVMSNQSDKKGLYGELIIDDYKIVRTRKGTKNGLSLWKQTADKKWEDVSKGAGINAIQKEIDVTVLGLNYETFANVFVFSDDDQSSFLECDAKGKREIVESLLSLEQYAEFHENAKAYVKQRKDELKFMSKEYERIIIEFDSCKTRIQSLKNKESDWRSSKMTELSNLKSKLEKLKQKLINCSDQGADLEEYNEAQETIKSLRLQEPELEEKRNKIQSMIQEVIPKYKEFEEKQQAVSKKLRDVDRKIEECEHLIKRHQKEVNKIGQTCPTCNGEIKEENFGTVIEESRKTVCNKKEELSQHEDSKKSLSDIEVKIKSYIQKYQVGIKDAENKLSLVNKELNNLTYKIANLSKIKKPEVGVDELLIQNEIDSTINQLKTKGEEAAGDSPYKEILSAAEIELDDKEKESETKKKEISDLETELPYYDFWVTAFGDKGIRKYVIDGIIPSMNNRLSYWLQFLVNGKIKLTLDNQLNETVDRYPFDGKPYVYSGLSNGQRRRLMLALGQSFAYVMTVNSGTTLSALFLDEVTMNMDSVGVEGVYRMICELSKNRQVFVIDHNENLLRLLDGCETIHLEMQNGITKKVNSNN